MTGAPPLHEEYKLRDARKNFLLDTNTFLTSEVYKDLRESKMRQLKKMEQGKLVLKRSKDIIKHLTNRHRKLKDKYQVYLEETRRQLKMFDKDYRTVSNEASKGFEELKDLVSTFKNKQ